MEDLAFRKLVPVNALPTASATYTGVLAHRSSDDTLHYCDGSSWTQLAVTHAHASSHQAGGADAIKLDDLAAADDNTDLNVSTSAHGLTPKLSNDATQFLSGTGAYAAPKKTGVYRTFYVPAGAMAPRETNGAAPDTEEYATNDVMIDHLLFDSVTEEGAQFQVAMPDEWDRGTIKAKYFWAPAAGASASDGVTLGLAARAVSNDDAVDAAFPSSVDTDDTVTAAGDLHISSASAAITVSGTPALGDLVFFEITRVVADANDDMAEDAKLVGIQIQYKESATEPAAW